ncbi:MAG: hypothetical protein Q8912_10185 [Bacillota bacterium]|nr:hypothetical protein [Bacillota bacterium]
MTERLNNTQIAKRIKNANSNLKHYLDLAPSLKSNPSHPKTANIRLPQPGFLKPKLKP